MLWFMSFFLFLRSTRRSCVYVCYFLFVIDVVGAGAGATAVADIIIDAFFVSFHPFQFYLASIMCNRVDPVEFISKLLVKITFISF